MDSTLHVIAPEVTSRQRMPRVQRQRCGWNDDFLMQVPGISAIEVCAGLAKSQSQRKIPQADFRQGLSTLSVFTECPEATTLIDDEPSLTIHLRRVRTFFPGDY